MLFLFLLYITFYLTENAHKFYLVRIISYFMKLIFCYLNYVKVVSISKVIETVKDGTYIKYIYYIGKCVYTLVLYL